MGGLDAVARAADAGMTVHEVALDLPLELDVDTLGDGSLRLGASPPTQIVETSVMPVFHRLVVRIVAEEA